MHPLDLAQLQTLVQVCESGSISAAAPKLCRSTSAISEQIRKLEADVGVRLLTRGKTGVCATAAGERLLSHARQLLVLSERAMSDARGQHFEGEIRLAITDYFRPAAIAGLLKQLRERYPRLRLHVAMRKSLSIEQASDDFDIGLAMRFDEQALSPQSTEVRREPLQWVGAAGLEFEPGQPLPLLAVSGCALQQYSCNLLEKAGIRYQIVYSTSGVGGLQSALTAGLGVACLNHGALPEGVVPYASGLPALTEARFVFLPARQGEAALVGEVRRLLPGYLA